MAKEGIIIIEDNPGDATIFMMAFKRSCPEKKVLWFDAGKQALDYIFCRNKYSERDPANVPELIVLDLSLPDISGKQILKELHPLMEKHDFEVVVITGSYDEHDKDDSYALGAKQFVSKSIATENSLKVLIAERPETSLQKMLKDACDFDHVHRH